MRTSRYLWINNLPPKVSEEEIRESLISHGKIHNVKIHEVADSKGAVVAFFDQTGATKAIESSNKIDGVTLKIEYCDLNGTPGLQRLQQQQQQQQHQQSQYAQLQNCEKNSEWVDERGNRAKSPLESHRNRSRSSSLSSTRSGRSNLTDASKHGSSSRRERNYQKASVDHVRRKLDKSDRERDHDENSQESGSESPPRFGEMRGLKVSQLPQRSSDSNIKEGLFHDLKRFGKITSVEVKGEDPSNRCAIVTFKRAEDAEKAYLKWNDKVYFFANVVVERHPGTDKEDPSFCQPEQVLNEFHPKSTKTLFVGNLHHDPDSPKAKQELIDTFEEFGSILEIDIKKQPNQSGVAYAFIQYADINSVVRALHKADSIKIGGKPVKLGFGKSQPTQCLWLSNLPSGTTDGFLANHFKRYGAVKYITLHPQQLRALVYFETVDSAQKALSEQKNRIIAGRKLQADYASARCQRHLLDQICQLTSYHMRTHPIADALRLAYSHAYMKTSYYHHYIRNYATRYDDSRSRSRHVEDMDLYDPYVEASRRGSNDYEGYSTRRSGGSSAVGSSNYPDGGVSGFGIESGNSRNNLCGSSSVGKKSDRNSVNKSNGPSNEPHYSRNRSDSPFSSKSSHSRDLRSRSRSPRVERKHRDSANRSHNRSDSSHSGEGEASADSSRQRVIRRRRSTTRGSHSLSAGVGNSNDSLPSTRSGQSTSTCLRREHRGPSSASTRTARIQRLKSEVKPAAASTSTNTRAPTRRINASDDDGESDAEAPSIAVGTNANALPSGHSGTGDSSSIHSGGSGGHRSDDATDIGELIAQREKLLREIIEMDGDASTISSSSTRTVSSENHRSKPLLREIVEAPHHDKLKTSQELNLPSDTRKFKEKVMEDDISRASGNDDNESKDISAKRRHTDTGIPSRLSNGPLSKPISVTVPLSSGFSSETSPPGQSKSDDASFKITQSSPKLQDTVPSAVTHEIRVPSTGSTSGYQFHKTHSLSFDGKSHPNQRILQHSTKSDQCSDQTKSSVDKSSHDGIPSSSERKVVTSSVTTCVNASRDPRLAPQQYGNRLVAGNTTHSKVDALRTSPPSVFGSNSTQHESSTERLTDLLQRFVQPVTAMAPTIAGQMEKVNSSRLSVSSDLCSPPPPPPPPPPIRHGIQACGVDSAVNTLHSLQHQHSLPKGTTSDKQSVYHDDSSTLADCEDPVHRSVMHKDISINRQIQELEMKIARAPPIDRSKYRIRPRSDSAKSASTTTRQSSGAPTITEGAPISASVTLTAEKPPSWKEETSISNVTELSEQSASVSLKSQDTSEFVKSMLMQSSRNNSFFMSNSAPVQNAGANATSSSVMPTSTTVSPPLSASSATNISSPWTSSPSCDDPHQPVSLATTSNPVTNRLNSPPIVTSSLGQPNSTSVTHYNRSLSTSSSTVPSHTVSNSCVTNKVSGTVITTMKSSSLSNVSNPVTINSTNPNNRPPRLSSISCSIENTGNSDTTTPLPVSDTHTISPKSPEHLKSILKKEQPNETKTSIIRSSVSPTVGKYSLPENCTVSPKNIAVSSSPNVSANPCSKARSIGTLKPTASSSLETKSTAVGVKRKHSTDDKKPCKVLKLESDSDGNLFRPDSFLFANKNDVKKEKRSLEQKSKINQNLPVVSDFNVDTKPISPVLEDMKSSPQLSNSSIDDLKSKKDDQEEKTRDRKFSVELNDSSSIKKRKPKDKTIESSDTGGSKPDDSDDETKHDSKRKRKKKLNRSKDELQRLEKKEKRKKRKKLDQNQILKKKTRTREKLKETEDKLKKLKQRKRAAETKDNCDLSDGTEKQQKKEKKEKVDRKCSNDDSNTEDEWKRIDALDSGGIYLSMYDLVKTKRKAEAAKNQGHHSKDHKKDSKSSRRKSGEIFKKSVFDSPENSVDESESRASSSKSVSTRKSKGKSSKKRRRTFNNSNLTSDDSDDREESSVLNKLTSTSKTVCNRFRLNSDEADDDTDYEDVRKLKLGKKKPEKKKSVDPLIMALTKKNKKAKLPEAKKKKPYTQDEVKKRRKKSSSNNKPDIGDSGKQKMSVASVFSDVDTDSSTGTDYRLRYDTKSITIQGPEINGDESDESQVSEDGLPILATPKSRMVRETAASSPTTPSTEPMSDDAVMTDLSLSGITPFPEKKKNPLKEALTSAHEESRKELKELKRESGILSDRHRAIPEDDVEVSEDLPSLEVMTGIVKSPSSIDDEPPAITCNDAPTLMTDDDVASYTEETVIEEPCMDTSIVEASDKGQSTAESSGSIVTSRTSSSAEEQIESTDFMDKISPLTSEKQIRDRPSVSRSLEISQSSAAMERRTDVGRGYQSDIAIDERETKVKDEMPDMKLSVSSSSDSFVDNSGGLSTMRSLPNCLNKLNTDPSKDILDTESKSETTYSLMSTKPLATVFPVEQRTSIDTPMLELPTKSQGPPEITKAELDDSSETMRTSNETGNKVEMVRYVQRIMERVSVDICEDNKGSGKRIKKGSGGSSCPSSSSHSNQNILASIADRGLSDRKPISSTTNPACLVPPGCNIYLEDSKMLPNLPASVTLTAPVLNPSCQPPSSGSGQGSQQTAPVAVISSGGFKGVTVNVNPSLARVTPTQPSPNTNNSSSVMNASLTVSKTNPMHVSVSNSNTEHSQVSVSQEVLGPSQIISQPGASNNMPASVQDIKSNAGQPISDSSVNANLANFQYSRRMLSRRKRNSSSNANSKSSTENEREGTWHAHVDEVLEKVVHGKSNSPHGEISKSSQSISHLNVKMEDQLMQQKETDEAVRTLEMSMIRGGSTDSPDANSGDLSAIKKDVDPYEPNFDEPSPSEINRNILTHSHHKRQDGITNENEDHRNSLPSRPQIFETLLTELSDKTQSQGKCPIVDTDNENQTAGRPDTAKNNSDITCHEMDVQSLSDSIKDQDKHIESHREQDECLSATKTEKQEKTSQSDAENKSDTMCPDGSNIQLELKDSLTSLKSKDLKKDAEASNLIKQSLSADEDAQSRKACEQLERQKTDQFSITQPQLIQLGQQPQLTQFNLQQLDLQKQLVKNQPPIHHNMSAPPLNQLTQSHQSVFMQAPSQDHAAQLQQIQHNYQFQQKSMNFPHLLPQKCVMTNTKSSDQGVNTQKNSAPSKLVDPVIAIDSNAISSSSIMSKELSSNSINPNSGTGTRKRTNRAMTQTALSHVDEILELVAHDEEFDLTQYSKDASNRRRSNSGEDHFPQQTSVMPSVLKDGSGMFTNTDLRVLTPRSASAMVSSKVGAEEQVQATLAQPQNSSSSVSSKVSIAPLVLGQFLKHGIQSQQFKQTRPASAVGINDAANIGNPPLIATVEPVFQQLALATSFASIPPAGTSISPALASSGISNKIAALTAPLQPMEAAKIVPPNNPGGGTRLGNPIPQPSVTPTTQACVTPSSQIHGATLTSNQPFAVAQATATVEDRGHAIERIPNPGLTAVQHHRDQISPRLLSVSSSTSPAATNISLDSKSNSSNPSLMIPVTGIVTSGGSRPSSNPVHLQANAISDSVPNPHQGRNFLPTGMTFDPQYEFQYQFIHQLMRQNHPNFSDKQLMDFLSMQYIQSLNQSSNSAAAAAATAPQFWPTNNDQRRDPHASTTNPILAGVPVQGIPPTGLPTKQPMPDLSIETLNNLQSKYTAQWKGKLALKNDEVFVQMLFITGNINLVNNCIKMLSGALGSVPVLQQALKIVQRMRMEQSQLEGVVRKMEEDHCMLLAVPYGDEINELETQANVLNSSFIKYLQEKTAAGIINVNHAESQQPAYVVHIFPPGEFSHQRLQAYSNELVNACGELPHLLVIITTV